MSEYAGSSAGWVKERFLRQRRYLPTFTVGAEAANVIAVDVQMSTYEATGNEYVDADESIALLCTLIDSQGQDVGAGRIISAVIAGGSAGPRVLTGITAKDQLLSVIHATAGGAVDGDFEDLTSEFSISGADEISNGGGTDTTGNKLIVLYRDRSVFQLAETGSGALVTGTGRGTVLATTSAAGACTITVTDVVGASGATLYLKVEPLNVPGFPAYAAVTFD